MKSLAMYILSALLALNSVCVSARRRFAVVTMVSNTRSTRLPPAYLLGACQISVAVRRGSDGADVLAFVAINATVLHARDASTLRLFEVEPRLHTAPVMRGEVRRPDSPRALKVYNQFEKRARQVAVQYVKIFVWSLYEYERVMYIDSDAVVTRDLGPLFHSLDPATTWFANGQMELMQGSWFLTQPDEGAFEALYALVYERRYVRNSGYNENGWLPGRKCLDDDQGLFECYFRYKSPGGVAVAVYDRRMALSTFVELQSFVHGARRPLSQLKGGYGPVRQKAYEHFGGQFKPWTHARGKAYCDKPKAEVERWQRSFRYPWSSAKRAAFQTFCEDLDKYPPLRFLLDECIIANPKSPKCDSPTLPICSSSSSNTTASQPSLNRSASEILAEVLACVSP